MLSEQEILFLEQDIRDLQEENAEQLAAIKSLKENNTYLSGRIRELERLVHLNDTLLEQRNELDDLYNERIRLLEAANGLLERKLKEIECTDPLDK